jgi:ATP-dependent Clp protease ATP-binding subunit ClpB
MESMPEELEGLERRLTQLEIEREALRKEKDQASKERLAVLQKEMAELKSQRDALKAQWIPKARPRRRAEASEAIELARNEWKRPSARAIFAAWPISIRQKFRSSKTNSKNSK